MRRNRKQQLQSTMRFERISKYADDESIKIPIRATSGSAGYDLAAAEDIIIPSYFSQMERINEIDESGEEPLTFEEMTALTKISKAKPTLVPTGLKIQLPKDRYLSVVARSSLPLKTWLVVANAEGIIDSDYYNSAATEGHIFIQLINLSHKDILIKKGTPIAQGIIHQYFTVDEDAAEGERKGGFGSTT